MKSEEDALARDRQLCLGQWQWMRKGWRQPQEIPRERKESKRTSETPQGIWLCYAGPLAEKRRSETSGKRHRPKPIP